MTLLSSLFKDSSDENSSNDEHFILEASSKRVKLLIENVCFKNETIYIIVIPFFLHFFRTFF